MVKKWWLHSIKIILLISLIIPILAGCAVSDTVKEQYPLESVNGSGSQTSYVYRAADQTVPEVAKQLVDKKKPEQQSPESTERMFLVYSDEVIQIQQATDDPADTLIEIDSKEYVRNNYSSSFLEGYLLASVLSDLFDNGRYGHGNYRGYSQKDVYKPQTTYHKPTNQDLKKAPPMTVNRTGSIFKRSKNADSSAVGSGSGSSSGSTGKVVTGGSSSSKKSGSVFTKPKKSTPKIRKGSGRISRRR
ncbi:DUF4247 domain-containing protein [Paenibacillus glycanilyticus]|uniref:DUF4247 domain-containing protein n=1 Tax=Paenibacillus glycanilyticus TaxID=126569 RepID=A0ABQ6GD92_9BACL|nr:DUF4247 domain-containing protein [Paenibacillus glycanilyticus]GLX68833.1 hypothetical protein MU1_31780 [Paenibacillus glycanilyticus]